MVNEKKPSTVKNKKGEVWRFIGTKHMLSNYGRCYSLTYKKIIKQFKNNSGYYRIKIGTKWHFTHIKVVELFGDINGVNLAHIDSLIDNGLSIDHIDRKKRNNKQSNLEIVTHQENCQRKFKKNDDDKIPNQ